MSEFIMGDLCRIIDDPEKQTYAVIGAVMFGSSLCANIVNCSTDETDITLAKNLVKTTLSVGDKVSILIDDFQCHGIIKKLHYPILPNV